MPIRSYPQRVLFSTFAASLLVVGLCGTVAYYLYEEQDRTAAVLQEDIGSRGANINLEATLNNLAALHNQKSREVEPLQEQARKDLADIFSFANKEQERQLADEVAAKFEEYLALWQGGAPPEALASFLQKKAVPAIVALREYNGRELQQSEEGHRQSLRRMAWGLIVVGGLGSVAGIVFGYGLARGLSRTIHQFLVRVEGASDLLGQEIPAVELQRSGEPLRDGGEDLLRRVEQVVSKLQQREREVRRAERLAAVGTLAAGVAHEIRNPLTAVILLLETARRDPSAGGLQPPDLELIEAELQRIEKSLQVLLDYARPPKIRRERVDFAALVREATNLTRGRIVQQQVTLQLELPPRECALEADQDQLRQVILNLLLNALDVMPHGGTLSLTVQDGGDPSTIGLNVTDSGPGIRADILPRLFEPFATGKETGLGLGLVVAKRIVDDHGGSIRGSNLPGGGACFQVRLPANNAPSF
jgi:two-component system sensor histidine kinase HydH